MSTPSLLWLDLVLTVLYIHVYIYIYIGQNSLSHISIILGVDVHMTMEIVHPDCVLLGNIMHLGAGKRMVHVYMDSYIYRDGI